MKNYLKQINKFKNINLCIIYLQNYLKNITNKYITHDIKLKKNQHYKKKKIN